MKDTNGRDTWATLGEDEKRLLQAYRGTDDRGRVLIITTANLVSSKKWRDTPDGTNVGTQRGTRWHTNGTRI